MNDTSVSGRCSETQSHHIDMDNNNVKWKVDEISGSQGGVYEDTPGDRVTQIYPQALRTHFSRLYDTHELRWEYFYPPVTTRRTLP